MGKRPSLTCIINVITQGGSFNNNHSCLRGTPSDNHSSKRH